MTLLRAQKVAGIARDIPPLETFGADEGDLLILGWGSTYGAIRSAVERLLAAGRSVAHAHLRYLNPFPAEHARRPVALQDGPGPRDQPRPAGVPAARTYLVDAVSYNRVRGKPFRIQEIIDEAERILGEGPRA